MENNRYIEATATGEVDEVYTTKTGMNLADKEIHREGWKQISEMIRRKVRVVSLTVHTPHLLVWEFVSV